jgi:hypothetical protein
VSARYSTPRTFAAPFRRLLGVRGAHVPVLDARAVLETKSAPPPHDLADEQGRRRRALALGATQGVAGAGQQERLAALDALRGRDLAAADRAQPVVSPPAASGGPADETEASVVASTAG